MNRIARRILDIQPFYVMDLLAQARALEAQGHSIVHMEIGEPDFESPLPIVQAGIQAIQAGYTHYTPAVGLPALREAIAAFYQQQYGVVVSPQRIVVTPGASGALQLLLGILINPHDQVLMSDPGYPCNRHFVRLFEGQATMIPVTAEDSYQLTAEQVALNWTTDGKAVLVASPANPTGTILSVSQLTELFIQVKRLRGYLIVDEIYQGLTYDTEPTTALSVSDEIFVINSFSKYFGMTGWRVGWIVAPERYVPLLDKLAQNIFLAPATPSQYAALAAFSPETRAILESRRLIFQQRRDYLVAVLRELGFVIPVVPQGAFYLYADCSHLTSDSQAFCQSLLAEAGVAITPGLDFGHYHAKQRLRFAYTTDLEQLKQGIARLRQFLVAHRMD